MPQSSMPKIGLKVFTDMRMNLALTPVPDRMTIILGFGLTLLIARIFSITIPLLMVPILETIISKELELEAIHNKNFDST